MSSRVQGKDRLVVKYVAGQLGLEGSYVPRTCIEQIQLKMLVNEVTRRLLLKLVMPFSVFFFFLTNHILHAFSDDVKTASHR